MGLALLNGIKNMSGIAIYGYDVDLDKKIVLEENGGVFLENETEIAERCGYILLAVKPQLVGGVLDKIAPVLKSEERKSVTVISICAGISADFIRSRTHESLKVICVMPNTPMMLGEGASAVSTDGLTSKEELDFACWLIGSCSPVIEIVPPDKMNEIICLNGSSPAFIYLFAKQFIDYAAGQGIDEKSAMRLFSQSLIGAGKMLIDNAEMSIDGLINQVSSKGGTTVAGLERLRETGFVGSVKSACEACTKRAYELGSKSV